MSPVKPRAPRQVVEDVYEDLAPLVRRIAARFARKYNQHLDDTLASANLYFLEAYHTFDPSRGTCLEQRVQYYVWHRLLDQVRTEAERNAAVPRVFDVVFESVPDGRGPAAGFDRAAVEGAVGWDAKEVLKLVLDTPADLLSAMKADTRPGGVRRALDRYLSVNLGWDRRRAAAAFGEIRAALFGGGRVSDGARVYLKRRAAAVLGLDPGPACRVPGRVIDTDGKTAVVRWSAAGAPAKVPTYYLTPTRE